MPDVDAFVRWTGEAPELSNQAVKAQWELTGKEIFRQALEWSEEVNRKIGAMPEEAKCAFDGVREALKAGPMRQRTWQWYPLPTKRQWRKNGRDRA